jgi:aspartate 1-decarboxylase
LSQQISNRMTIQVLKSKIHKAIVTQAELNYEGSITIDEDLMIASKIVEWERVLVVNNNNGERLETYVIKGERGSGVICMNGAAARKVQVGDELIIMSFATAPLEVAANWMPTRVFVNNKNKQV